MTDGCEVKACSDLRSGGPILEGFGGIDRAAEIG